MARVYIFDTTLRDGEQVPGSRLESREKLVIAKKLEALGADVIEAGFPVSSPGDFEAVQLLSKEIKNTTICALTRAVEKDIEIAAQALKQAVRPRIHTGIATSSIHIRTKLRSTPQEVTERAVKAIKYAKKFVEDVEFYAEDAGRTDNEFLAFICEKAILAGATVLNIPDTTGYCLPSEYGAKIAYLFENVKGIHKVIVSTHCHNDLGLATANSLAGIENGARQIECTINGIGERAGNTSLEEVVMTLKQRYSTQFETSINTKLLSDLSETVSRTMRIPVQPNKAIVGANAFAHSSGIHQDGVIKNRSNYEIIDPKDVGAENSQIILTARSGRAALAYRLMQCGNELNKEQLDIAYREFLKVADEQREVGDEDLKMMMNKLSAEIHG